MYRLRAFELLLTNALEIDHDWTICIQILANLGPPKQINLGKKANSLICSLYFWLNKFGNKSDHACEIMDWNLFAASLWIQSQSERIEIMRTRGWRSLGGNRWASKPPYGMAIAGRRGVGATRSTGWRAPSWPRSGTTRSMPAFGRAIRGSAGRRAPQTGGTTRISVPWHGHRGGGSNGSGDITWYTTIARTMQGSKTTCPRNALFPNIDSADP